MTRVSPSLAPGADVSPDVPSDAGPSLADPGDVYPSLLEKHDASCPGAGDTSRRYPADPSPLQADDTSPTAASDGCCRWCRVQLPEARSDTRYCSKRCRQTAWRARKGARIAVAGARAMRMAYADPPYPGFARALYGKPEVDHAALIASLSAEYDGWALSTSAAALRDVLPLCPAGVRVCAWVKPIGAAPATWGIHNTWEPLIVSPGRSLRPGKRDWLAAQPARRGGDLVGRKPLAFCRWLFAMLGLLPGDTLMDLFPGTGIVGRAWAQVSLGPASATAAGDGCNGTNGRH